MHLLQLVTVDGLLIMKNENSRIFSGMMWKGSFLFCIFWKNLKQIMFWQAQIPTVQMSNRHYSQPN